jgi:hypothetical protein
MPDCLKFTIITSCGHFTVPHPLPRLFLLDFVQMFSFEKRQKLGEKGEKQRPGLHPGLKKRRKKNTTSV